MRQLLIFILLSSSVCTYAQPGRVEYKKVSIGVSFSPAYCFRNLNYQENNMWIQEQRSNTEEPVFGYSAGIKIRYKLNKKYIITTGLLFSVNGEQTKYQLLEWQDQSVNYPLKSKTQFHYQYLEFPLHFAQYFDAGKFTFFATAGLSLDIFTQKKSSVVILYSNGSKSRDKSSVDIGYLKLNIAVCAGAGIEYNCSKRTSISIEPCYTRILNSIVADKNAKEYNYSFQCNVGVFYKLKGNTNKVKYGKS